MIKNLLLVGLGGGVGSMLRYFTSVCLSRHNLFCFPWATFTVNILGCLLMGVVLGVVHKHELFNNDLRILFTIGFCGGFTTFSAFSSENLRLFEGGNYHIGIIYIVSSVLLGIAAIWFGNWIVK